MHSTTTWSEPWINCSLASIFFFLSPLGFLSIVLAVPLSLAKTTEKKQKKQRMKEIPHSRNFNGKNQYFVRQNAASFRHIRSSTSIILLCFSQKKKHEQKHTTFRHNNKNRFHLNFWCGRMLCVGIVSDSSSEFLHTILGTQCSSGRCVCACVRTCNIMSYFLHSVSVQRLCTYYIDFMFYTRTHTHTNTIRPLTDCICAMFQHILALSLSTHTRSYSLNLSVSLSLSLSQCVNFSCKFFFFCRNKSSALDLNECDFNAPNTTYRQFMDIIVIWCGINAISIFHSQNRLHIIQSWKNKWEKNAFVLFTFLHNLQTHTDKHTQRKWAAIPHKYDRLSSSLCVRRNMK